MEIMVFHNQNQVIDQTEFEFKIRKIKEKDYNKNKDPYIQALRQAAEPMRVALEAWAKDIEEFNKLSKII